MPSEEDPLLPRNKGAPEINYGHSGEEVEIYDINDTKSTTNITSPIRAFFVLFTVVVGLGLLVTLFAPGGVGFPSDRYPRNETLSIKTRVEKILSENPLIGNTLLDSCDVRNVYF
jgi:hypothetical protein